MVLKNVFKLIWKNVSFTFQRRCRRRPRFISESHDHDETSTQGRLKNLFVTESRLVKKLFDHLTFRRVIHSLKNDRFTLFEMWILFSETHSLLEKGEWKGSKVSQRFLFGKTFFLNILAKLRQTWNSDDRRSLLLMGNNF